MGLVTDHRQLLFLIRLHFTPPMSLYTNQTLILRLRIRRLFRILVYHQLLILSCRLLLYVPTLLAPDLHLSI